MLDDLREALLALHGVVIGEARAEWEATNGPVTPTEYLRLLTEDAAFAWLSPMTKLLVRIDEAIDEEARHRRGNPRASDLRLDEERAEMLRQALRVLLEEDSAFLDRYRQFLQNSIEIAGLHAIVRGHL